MKHKRKNRLLWILLLMCGSSLAVVLMLYALNNNINLYYTPKQLLIQPLILHHAVRLGGVVKRDSVKRKSGSLTIHFIITDFHQEIPVAYSGIVPSLFREGQGVIAKGTLNKQGLFVATEILAKHDENYQPPSIKVHS